MPQPNKRFVITFCCTALLLASTIILFNWLVDPFEAFDRPKVGHFNQIKTELDSQQRLYKAMAIARLKPKAIFLGSSRVLIGLDPESLKPHIDESAYNAAFQGANFEEIYAFFEHALYHQPELKMVVIGLDFFAFNKNKKAESDFLTLNLKSPSLSLKQLNSLLFTKNATVISLATIKSNLLNNPQPLFQANGHPIVTAGDPKTNPILAMGEKEYLRQLLNSKSWYKDYHLCEERIGLFQKLVDTCRAHGIALHVFINPCKAIYWNSLHDGNLWEQIETWKKRLAAIYTVWDFSGFNAITTDESNYFDCSHYKPEIGNLILSSFFGSPSFGHQLTLDTIEGASAQMRVDRDAWINKIDH